MEIIKRGCLPGERIFDVTCSHCTTIFRFKQSEGKIGGHQLEPPSIMVNCPVCSRPAFADLGAGKAPPANDDYRIKLDENGKLIGAKLVPRGKPPQEQASLLKNLPGVREQQDPSYVAPTLRQWMAGEVGVAL